MRTSIYEKFSLQEYSGKLRYAIVDELKELNKSAVLVSMFIHKFSLFITTRTIKDSDLNCILTLIYYNVYGGKPTYKFNFNVVGPDVVDGATAYDKAFIYIPVYLDEVPFSSGSLNEECTDEVYEDCSSELVLKDGVIRVNNYDSISGSIKRLNEKYNDNIYDFLDSLPIEAYKAKKSLNIDPNYVIKTVKHELTHAMDRDTAGNVNFFGGIGIDDVNKRGLTLALNILYTFWSRTEFNAYMQTFSTDDDKQRKIVKSDYINKVSLRYLSRPCTDGGNISLDTFISNAYDALDELDDPSYDEEFWDAIRKIVAEGSRESAAKERFTNMSPMKFRNYFFKTTEKIIEKFNDNLLKNIASQNTYDHDISNLAYKIQDEVNNVISNYSKGDPVEIKFKYDQYLKQVDQASKIVVEFETPYFGSTNVDDDLISNNSSCYIVVHTLHKSYDSTPKELFGNSVNSYSLLYKEIITKQRKSAISKLCINLAEDLYNIINKIAK